MVEDLDLGSGISARLVFCECTDPTCDKQTPCGLYWSHPPLGGVGNGARCEAGSYVPLRGPGAWTLESLEPLTLSPSLLCNRCKTHGFIRGGQWVPA